MVPKWCSLDPWGSEEVILVFKGASDFFFKRQKYVFHRKLFDNSFDSFIVNEKSRALAVNYLLIKKDFYRIEIYDKFYFNCENIIGKLIF